METAARTVIVVLGTLDTKGHEVAFVADEVRRHGYPAYVMDIGMLGEVSTMAQMTRDEVARAAGTSLAVVATQERTDAMLAMGRGAAAVLNELHSAHRLAGRPGSIDF